MISEDQCFSIFHADGAPGSAPVLIDSLPPGKKFKKRDDTLSLHFRIRRVSCLAGDEHFAIILHGKTDHKCEITIRTSEAISPHKDVSMRLVGDTSYLDGFVEGGSGAEFQPLSLLLELSGIPAKNDNMVTLSLPSYLTSSLLSQPLLVDSMIQVPLADFQKDGCPVRIHIPAIVKLKKVDSLLNDEYFYLMVKSDINHIHSVFIRKAAASAKKLPKGPPAPVSTPAFVGKGFSFVCGRNTTFYVELHTDSTGKVRSIAVNVNEQSIKNILNYYILNYFDAGNFSNWLVSHFGTGINTDCASYLSDRVLNEMKELSAPPAATAPAGTTSGPSAAPAIPVSAPTLPATPIPTPATPAGTAKPASPATTAAQSVRLDGLTTVLHPLYSKSDTGELRRIDFYVVTDSVPTSMPEADTLSFTLERYTLPATTAKENFSLFTDGGKPVVIQRNQWVNGKNIGGDSASYSAPVHLYFKNQAIDTLHGDRFANIRLKGNDSSFHVLQITETGTFNPSYPFWLDLGTNFDLLDGIQAKNLYSGVYGFKKDVAKVHLFRNGYKKNSLNLSFTGGAYESRSSSVAFGSDSGYIYRDGSSYVRNATNLQYPYYRDTGSVTNTIIVTSLGMFFSPHLRLTNTPTDQDGFHLFVSFYMELLWQRVSSNFDYSQTGRDTTMYIDDLNKLYAVPYKEKSRSIDYRSHYLGMGLPIYIKDKIFSLYLNSVLGFTNQRFVIIEDSNWVHTGAYKRPPPTPVYPGNQPIIGSSLNALTGFQQPACSWNPFYLFQFRLNEEKYGISFTGEARGLLLRNAKPIVSLALSKKFDLADVFNMIVKPFTPGTN